MKKLSLITWSLIFILSGAAVLRAQAATLKPAIVSSVSGVTTVGVMIDPQLQSVNAVSGTLHYDPAVLSLKALRTTDSIVSFWIEQPRENTLGTITWSGVIPGGFDGVRSARSATIDPGVIFTMVLVPRMSGTSTITIDNTEVLLNDGNATAIAVTSAPLNVSVDGRFADAVITPEQVATDSEAHLTATLIRDSVTTNNKWMLAFTTDTNRVSIDRYEVAESFRADPSLVSPNSWNIAESPYLLHDQYRSKYVHVRAIAQNGHAYVTTVAPADFSTATTWFTWSILTLVIVILLMISAKRIAQKRHT